MCDKQQGNEYLFKNKYFILHGEIKKQPTCENNKKRTLKARRQYARNKHIKEKITLYNEKEKNINYTLNIKNHIITTLTIMKTTKQTTLLIT